MFIKIYPAILDFPGFPAADGQTGCASRSRVTLPSVDLKTACLTLCNFFRHLKCETCVPLFELQRVKTMTMSWGMKGQYDFFWAVPN